MSFSMSFTSDRGNPRCFFTTDDGKRAVQESASAVGRAAASLLRSAIAFAMVGLSVVEPRLIPLFALAVPFWIALELEGKVTARATRS
jgi:hypothetical protein